MRIAEFQFLIGRLGTGANRRFMQAFERFQFLIGRLGTWGIPEEITGDDGFNSS